ncbi:MAG: acetate kinase [Alphaproteobacteria bacterium]|nr:acetate kinase [Alphaproteobacteria bacterium]
MYIMALNCGSSSLKYQIFDADSKKQVVGGNVEKIGSPDSFITQKYPDGTKQKKEVPMKNHNDALGVVMGMLRDASVDMNEIRGVGHRVVMGGSKFASSVEITDEVMREIQNWRDLMPLHIPASLMGIESARQMLPNATQVAVFDTAFLQTMPESSYRYAIPEAWYKNLGVRRYGFHGTSHLYVSKRAAAMLGKPADKCNLITMHIGSGASGVAIKNGIAVDTTLGMTPTAGLVMGTRPGDVDAGALLYVMEKLKLTPEQMTKHMNKDSGLMGITKCFADRRDVESNRETNPDCKLALEIEVHNVKKYIGAFMAELGHVDALVFTAGVGENDNYLRAKYCEGLEELGIKIDPAKNDKALARLDAGECEISAPDSRVKIFMIPTNEEIVIVEDTIGIMNKTYDANHLKMQYSFAKMNEKQK